MNGYMSTKDFAAAVGISTAKARKLAPTIPGAVKDPDKKVAGRAPWLIPDSAIAWFREDPEPAQAEAAKPKTPKPEPEEPTASPFPQPPAVETPPPGEAGTRPLTKYWPVLGLLLALVMMKPGNPRGNPPQTGPTWPI